MTHFFTRGNPKWRLLGLVSLLLIGSVGGLLGYCEHASTSRPEGNPELVEIEIERGISMTDLIDRLKSKGMITNRLVAQYIMRREKVFGTLKAGRYQFKGNLNLVEMCDALKAGPNVHPLRRFTIRPGQSLYEVSSAAEKLNLASAKEFLAAAQNFPRSRALSRHFLGDVRAPRPDGEPWLYLEGLLAADTYFLDSASDLNELLQLASKRFHTRWDEARAKRSDAAHARHSSLALGDYELLTLASLVEEETRVPSEAARIAGVFFNRLQRGMALKSDPTAMYRSAKVGKPPTPKDTRDSSNPYNTYAHKGLPPGPICAPGPGAIDAVFSPEEHDFLFFVAARNGTGEHVFARTGREHMRNVNKHLRNK